MSYGFGELRDKDTTLISVKLEMGLYKSLKKHCEEKDIYMSVLVRNLIAAELRKEKYSIPESVADLK